MRRTGRRPARRADVVGEIIEAVRERGDEAVREYSERFDSWTPDSFRLSEEEIADISLSTFHLFDKENACNTVQTAWRGCGGCRGWGRTEGGQFRLKAAVRLNGAHNRFRAPSPVAGVGTREIGLRYSFEPAGTIELPSHIASNRRNVWGAGGTGRSDSLLVQPFGIDDAIFQARQLCCRERGTAAECILASSRPSRELRVVIG